MKTKLLTENIHLVGTMESICNPFSKWSFRQKIESDGFTFGELRVGDTLFKEDARAFMISFQGVIKAHEERFRVAEERLLLVAIKQSAERLLESLCGDSSLPVNKELADVLMPSIKELNTAIGRTKIGGAGQWRSLRVRS